MQFSTATEQKEGAITFWFDNDPSPSWRRLIVGLDEIEANEAAEKIRKYAEPLGGKCTQVCIVTVVRNHSEDLNTSCTACQIHILQNKLCVFFNIPT